jgi:hypothetical protein
MHFRYIDASEEQLLLFYLFIEENEKLKLKNFKDFQLERIDTAMRWKKKLGRKFFE